MRHVERMYRNIRWYIVQIVPLGSQEDETGDKALAIQGLQQRERYTVCAALPQGGTKECDAQAG